MQPLSLALLKLRIGLRGHLLEPLPGAERLARLPAERLRAGVRVEQLALRGRAQQRLVLVLAVDVDQEFACLAQLRERRGVTVDEATRAASAIDGSSQNDGAGVA